MRRFVNVKLPFKYFFRRKQEINKKIRRAMENYFIHRKGNQILPATYEWAVKVSIISSFETHETNQIFKILVRSVVILSNCCHLSLEAFSNSYF